MDGTGGTDMRLWSDDFEQGGPIPKLHTCDGRDLSPHLAWDGAPQGTMSLALIVDDPDAPAGTWVHWLVCDIAPDATAVPRGTVPQGARRVRNDFGKLEYGGPCPPGGTHRYFHRLYALRVPRLEGATDKRSFYQLVERHKLAQAELMGTYTRGRW
jgi:Raf kinase inhibitor-like YbhB/YbcL family protein